MQKGLRSHGTDTAKRRETTLTHTTDASKKRSPQMTHATSAFLKKGYVATHATSAAKVKGHWISHGTDIAKRREILITHATSVSKRKWLQISHATDTAKRKETSLLHATDTTKKRSPIRAHSTSAFLIRAFEITHATSASKLSGPRVSHGTDIAKRREIQILLTHSTSVTKARGPYLAHGTDTYLVAQIETPQEAQGGVDIQTRQAQPEVKPLAIAIPTLTDEQVADETSNVSPIGEIDQPPTVPSTLPEALSTTPELSKNSPTYISIGSGLSTMLGLSRVATWNTLGRPKTPKRGTIGFNTELKKLEIWNGSAWFSVSLRPIVSHS